MILLKRRPKHIRTEIFSKFFCFTAESRYHCNKQLQILALWIPLADILYILSASRWYIFNNTSRAHAFPQILSSVHTPLLHVSYLPPTSYLIRISVVHIKSTGLFPWQFFAVAFMTLIMSHMLNCGTSGSELSLAVVWLFIGTQKRLVTLHSAQDGSRRDGHTGLSGMSWLSGN